MRFAFFVFLLACAGAASAAESPITLQARGLMVAGDGYGEFMDGVQPFNNRLGTRVAVLAMAPGGGLLRFNEDASKIATFQDDKGKNLLLTKRQTFGKSAGFGAFASISKDTKACMLEIESPEPPSKGAVEFTLAGEAVFTFATQKQDFTAENVALKAGTKFKAGPLEFEVKKVGKASFDAERWPHEVEFGFKQSTAALVGIKFVDAAGTEIQTERGMSSRMSFNGSVDETVSFRMKKSGDTVKVVATFWTDMKDVKIPFNLKVGPGL